MEPMDTRPFEISFYVRSPVFTVQEGIAMARALCSRCPKSTTVTVKRARDRLSQVADAAQTALSNRHRQDNQVSDEDNRLLDQLMDALWAGMRSVLEGLAGLLPKEPRGQRARLLSNRLFGSTGLAFLKDNYASQHTSMMALLERIQEDKLDKEINELCGPEFLANINELLPRYQRMVDAMLSRDSEPTTNLLTHRHALSRAVVSYATAICALVDQDDSASVEQARQALAPLEGQRNAAAARRSSGESEPTPASPNDPGAAAAPQSL